MSRPELLSVQGRNYATAWAEFIQQYKNDPDLLYCFYEGFEDSKYYNPRIKATVFHNAELKTSNIWCLGKGNVLKLYSLISGDHSYSAAWVAFFLDRDFDLDEIPEDKERIYVTPCYSIENLYLHPECIEQVLLDEFQLTRTDVDFPKTLGLYEQRLREYNDAVEELNAWLYIQRSMAVTAEVPVKIHLRELSMEKFVAVSLSLIIKKYTLADLAKKFPDAPTVSSSEINQRIKIFRSLDRTMIFRGKFHVYFLSKLLRLLAEDRRKRGNWLHFSERRVIQLDLSENILSELTQYAHTPSCLVLFLESLRDRKIIQKNLGISEV